ncbi:basic phospholipase A2 2 isoform X2 [Aethina tumida]|uniref:basic phospholipase A2 2 isoform X2 n=1 Tax=Aethina tumida TaxID=116153 RepID=UPI00096B0437|nr:basic phospholipase A2 2 isoform X2 [Aethina tumida]
MVRSVLLFTVLSGAVLLDALIPRERFDIVQRPNDANITFMGYSNNPFGYSLRVSSNNSIQLSVQNIPRESRNKRGVLDLYNMVNCATGCNPLKYKGYGCFCGFLGSGYPVDGIDRCCKLHDWCYDAANCPMFLEYFVPYLWKCYHNKPLCAIHGDFKEPNSCARRLCECDRRLSECLKRYPCPSSRAFCRSAPLRFIQNSFPILT